jgi:hypothetical protein
LAVTRTLYFEGSWFYLLIKHDGWVGTIPYPVAQEIELAGPLKFSCLRGGGALSIHLDLAAWRPLISGEPDDNAFCLVCGASKVSIRAGYYDAGWRARTPSFCSSRPDGAFLSEELSFEVVDPQQEEGSASRVE